jgi:hypothetical protein
LTLCALCIGALAGASPIPAAHLDTPVLAQHADVEVVATTPCGSTSCAVVSYSFDITGGTAPYQLSCNVPSGSSVALGTYAVTCTATDAANVTSASSSFSLWVVAPTLSIAAPADMTVEATTPCGTTDCALVAYSFTVTGGYPPYNLICNLPSGSPMTVGSHPVTCMAQDSKGDSTPNATFNVTVTAPSSPPVVSGGSSYVPDVTGCAVSSCMANSLSWFSISGVSCDSGSFNASQTSYACNGPATVTSPVTATAGNQTNDVSVSFQLNGSGVGVAARNATGQQSGIGYTSASISLSDGTNTITATVDDPLGRLPATVYTWTVQYDAPAAPSATTPTATPTTTSSSGAAGSGSSPPRASGASSTGGATGGGTPTDTATGATGASGAATTRAPLAHPVAASPSIASTRSGRESLSFAVRLPRAGTVVGTLATGAGRTVLHFRAKERAGRSVIRRMLRAHVAKGTRLTLRLVLHSGSKSLTRTFRFRA